MINAVAAGPNPLRRFPTVAVKEAAVADGFDGCALGRWHQRAAHLATDLVMRINARTQFFEGFWLLNCGCELSDVLQTNERHCVELLAPHFAAPVLACARLSPERASEPGHARTRR